MTRLKQFDILFLLQHHRCSIGSTLVDNELEKSDKAEKTEVHNLASSLMQPVFDRLDTGLWQYNPVREREERSF